MSLKGQMVGGKWENSRTGLLHQAMMQRCEVDGSYQKSKPTYKGCLVSDNFKDFSYFHNWCLQQKGYSELGELDKDLLGDGKMYSEDICVFLPRKINGALSVKRAAKTSGLLEGVHFKKSHSKYVAQAKLGGDTQKHLGIFETELEAHNVYIAAKKEYLKLLAAQYESVLDKRAYNALLDWGIK